MVNPKSAVSKSLPGREAIFGGGSCRSDCFHDHPNSELAVQ